MSDYRLHGQTFTEWATDLFEYELCDECGGSADDHDPAIVLDNWYAKCRKGGTDE